MSRRAQNIVKKLVVLATLAGLGSAIAFLLVACGGAAAERAAAAWQALPAAPVRIDDGPTSVWTGKELIVYGVRFGPSGNFIQSTQVAAGYDPATHTWRRLARPPKMDSYCHRSAAWTGREVLVWGCRTAAFNPLTNRWRQLPQPPTGEGIAIWTGRELIGWGGGCCGDAWDGGSAYDPAANTWRTLARSPLTPAQGAIGAWAGHELVLFVSGIDPSKGKPYPAGLARAAAYDPAADTWRRLAPPPFSGSGFGSAAAWDGHEVLVAGAGSSGRSAFAYDPAKNRWRRLSPLPFGVHKASVFWTGDELVAWGGSETGRGARYDPRTDRWSALPPAPLRGFPDALAWTGQSLIVASGIHFAAFTPSG
jgi:N-acetylneuraminic acid mutarotase